jgi:uncharacterized protein YndB with AHSA1/START domain
MSQQLEVTTPSDREVAMTRTFDAPRRLLFEAITRPELLKRWMLGPDGWSMPICEFNGKVGSAYRFVWRRDRDGREMGMGGVIREMSPPERMVLTERFDDAWYPGEAITTHTLVEKAGKTIYTVTALFESREARDVTLKSGMEKGVVASYERLDRILASPEE